MEKNRSEINILIHISDSLLIIFSWLKTLKFFVADPGYGSGIRYLFDAGSGMEKFGSRINLPDP
jgi:hypothetical protein